MYVNTTNRQYTKYDVSPGGCFCIKHRPHSWTGWSHCCCSGLFLCYVFGLVFCFLLCNTFQNHTKYLFLIQIYLMQVDSFYVADSPTLKQSVLKRHIFLGGMQRKYLLMARCPQSVVHSVIEVFNEERKMSRNVVTR